jgi:galactonate dehydratase
MVEMGFTAVKFDPAGPYTNYSGHQLSMGVLDRCELFCAKIREAIGSRADILFGTLWSDGALLGDPAGKAAGEI